jgi:hypothetical protein
MWDRGRFKARPYVCCTDRKPMFKGKGPFGFAQGRLRAPESLRGLSEVDHPSRRSSHPSAKSAEGWGTRSVQEFRPGPPVLHAFRVFEPRLERRRFLSLTSGSHSPISIAIRSFKRESIRPSSAAASKKSHAFAIFSISRASRHTLSHGIKQHQWPHRATARPRSYRRDILRGEMENDRASPSRMCRRSCNQLSVTGRFMQNGVFGN